MEIIAKAFKDYGLKIDDYSVYTKEIGPNQYAGEANFLMKKVTFCIPSNLKEDDVIRSMFKFTVYHELGHLLDKSTVKCLVRSSIYSMIPFTAMKVFDVSTYIALPVTAILFMIGLCIETKKSEHRANINACHILIKNKDYMPIACYLAGLYSYYRRGISHTAPSHPKVIDEIRVIQNVLDNNNIQYTNDISDEDIIVDVEGNKCKCKYSQ